MAMTVSFPLAVLESKICKEEQHKALYKELTKSMKEEDVAGIQMYPSDWPRKVQITLRDRDMKKKLVIEGIDIFGMHIELKDESSVLQKVIVRDAPIEWNDKQICDILSGYGQIVRIEKEMIHHEGKKTSWTTGTRYVYMGPVETPIPTHLSVYQGDKQITISVWYEGQYHKEIPTLRYERCGDASSTHFVQPCTNIGKSSGHRQRARPGIDGCKHTDNVVCYVDEKSVLSNFNMEFPITILGQTYSCNEQYIQAEKAAMFMDFAMEKEIMASTDPREMKRLGNKVRNYSDIDWEEVQHEVVITCVREKFKSHATARQYLLDTGNKKINEASQNILRGEGGGYNTSHPEVLSMENWYGANNMGMILEEVREEIRSEVDDRSDQKWMM